MGRLHDTYSDKIGLQILSGIRNGDKKYKQIFSKATTRIGWSGWPQPDFMCEDPNLSKSIYALEFKPPNQSKREYLTGLGQSLSYLSQHNYSGLIIPEKTQDNYPIAEFIQNLLSVGEFKDIPVSLFAYNKNTLSDSLVEVSTLVEIDKPRSSILSKKLKGYSQDIFWCWWRDNSVSEVYDLLYLSSKYSHKDGDIYSKYTWPTFWNMLTNGKTQNWEGAARKISRANETSHKQNYKVPLNQLGLHNPADGSITGLGRKFLSIGEMFGKNSFELRTYLAQLVLINGKHLELIDLLEKYQNQIDTISNSTDFIVNFEQYLVNEGILRPQSKRKPNLLKTGAKPSYIRDEFKLWNKLGILHKKSNRIFRDKSGYVFNVNKISKILMFDADSLFI